MKNSVAKQRLYGFLVLLGGASYGFVSPVVKLAYAHGFSAGDVTVGQFYYAAVILWLIVLLTRGWDMSRITKGDWVRMVILGLLGTATAVLYYESLTTLPAWLAIIMLFQFSWITFLIDFLATRRKPSGGQWFGILSIAVGTLLAVNISADSHTHITAAGILFGLASAVSYAGFLHVNGGVGDHSSPFLRAALMTTVSAIAVSVIYFPTPAQIISVSQMWFYGGLIGLLSQAIPTSLFSIGIPRIGGSAAAILGSVELPVAVILAAVLLHEQVLWTGWVGVALILAGIMVGERARPVTHVK